MFRRFAQRFVSQLLRNKQIVIAKSLPHPAKPFYQSCGFFPSRIPQNFKKYLYVLGLSLCGGGLWYKMKPHHINQSIVSYVKSNESFNSSNSLRHQFNFINTVVQGCASGVVYIEIEDLKTNDSLTGHHQISNGSGFLINEDGWILTNAHVVINKPKNLIKVTLNDGSTYDATVANADMNMDLALLKIKTDRKFPFLRLGRSSDVNTGEWVIALGSPLSLSHTVTAGVVSSVDRGARELGLRNFSMRYIQTDAAITFGNSGGPLVNLDGDVIGINNLRVTAGISFAIPVDYAKKFLEQSRIIQMPDNVNFQRVQQKQSLGVVTMIVTPELISYLNELDREVPQDTKQGVLVWKVLEDTPAARGGLELGDIITHVNTIPISVVNNVYSLIEKNTETLKLDIIRHGSKKKVILHVT
ncbi:hypothetical protein FQA39_LY10946 [Lamprigera yunnana]|nr:hypothetical protein FQA39_LY10946 [Lamprigera yunnana]